MQRSNGGNDLKGIVGDWISSLKNSSVGMIIIGQRKVFFIAALLVAILGIGVFSFWPRSYSASVTLMLISEGNKTIGGGGDALKMNVLMSLAGGGLASSPNQQKILNILNSRTLSEMVVEDLQLQKDFLKQDIPLTADLKTGIAQAFIERMININTRKPGLIEFRVSYKHREMVKPIIASYIKNLRAYLKGSILTIGQKTQSFLDEETKKSLEDLNLARDALVAFQIQHRVISAQAILQNLQSGYDEVQASLNTTQANQKYLMNFLAPENPYLKSEESRIKSLKVRLKELERDTFKSANPREGSATSVALEYLRLEREMLLKQMVYEALSREHQIAKIDASRDDLSFEILDDAVAPGSYSVPNPKIFSAMVLMLMLLIEVALFGIFYSRSTPALHLERERDRQPTMFQ